MNKISSLITEDSVIKFTDGSIAKGSDGVARLIVTCCRSYNEAFVAAMTRDIVRGGIGAIVIIGASVGIAKVIKSKTKNKEEGK